MKHTSGIHNDDLVTCGCCGCQMKRGTRCPDPDCGHLPDNADYDRRFCNSNMYYEDEEE